MAATAAAALSFSLSSSHPFQLHLPSHPLPLRRRMALARFTAKAAVSTAEPEAPEISPPSIILVDRSEAEKVHRLKTTYLEKVVPRLKEEFSYTNVHLIPKIEKIVVNCGMGGAQMNAKGMEAAMDDLATITGQRPVKTVAKESIAAFKIRQGATIGIAVTLRGKYMYAFLDRLINIGLPRSMDFLGVNPHSFDGYGNYSLGIRDQSVFPELGYAPVGQQRGMNVTIKTTAKNDNEAQRLLMLLGMPFGDFPAPTLPKKRMKTHHYQTKSSPRSKPKTKSKKK